MWVKPVSQGHATDRFSAISVQKAFTASEIQI